MTAPSGLVHGIPPEKEGNGENVHSQNHSGMATLLDLPIP